MSFVQYMLFLCVNYIKCFSKEIWWIIMCIYFLYLIWVQTPSIYGSRGVKFAFFKTENIFLHVYPQNYFPQNCFSQNLFCFSYFYRGRSLFFNLDIHGGVVTLHRKGCLYFLWSWIVLCSLNSLFSLDFCCVCFLFILCLSCLC